MCPCSQYVTKTTTDGYSIYSSTFSSGLGQREQVLFQKSFSHTYRLFICKLWALTSWKQRRWSHCRSYCRWDLWETKRRPDRWAIQTAQKWNELWGELDGETHHSDTARPRDHGGEGKVHGRDLKGGLFFSCKRKKKKNQRKKRISYLGVSKIVQSFSMYF